MTKIYNSPHFYNPDYHFEGEFWKPIGGFTNYKVSNMGRILSEKRTKDHIRRLHSDRDGYAGVGLFNGSNLTKKVHRLVGIAWIENPQNKPEINHIDANKLNNCVSNLEWVTRLENQEHREKTNPSPIGEDCYNAKLKNADIPIIRSMVSEKITYKNIGAIFGVSDSLIHLIAIGKRWGHVK